MASFLADPAARCPLPSRPGIIFLCCPQERGRGTFRGARWGGSSIEWGFDGVRPYLVGPNPKCPISQALSLNGPSRPLPRGPAASYAYSNACISSGTWAPTLDPSSMVDKKVFSRLKETVCFSVVAEAGSENKQDVNRKILVHCFFLA